MDVLYGVRMAGLLAPYARGLAGELARLGFTEPSARSELGLAAHRSQWLEAAGMGTAELTGATVEAYLAARRVGGYTAYLTLKVLPVLQPRLPEGQQHLVDAGDLQPHMTGQDLDGDTR